MVIERITNIDNLGIDKVHCCYCNRSIEGDIHI